VAGQAAMGDGARCAAVEPEHAGSGLRRSHDVPE